MTLREFLNKVPVEAIEYEIVGDSHDLAPYSDVIVQLSITDVEINHKDKLIEVTF